MSTFPILLAQEAVTWSFGLTAIVIADLVFVTWVVWMVTTGWSKARESTRRHELKRLMIERGMSADEIERVLVAGTGKPVQLPQHDETSAPAKPQAGPIKWPVHSNN